MKGQLALFTEAAVSPAPRPVVVEAPVVAWSGVTRAGVVSSGVLEDLAEVEAFVRARYRGRWRSLEVTVAGQVVAAIIPDPDHPVRRSLWIEGAQP